MKVTFGSHNENAEVQMGSKFTKGGKNWQYFKVFEANNRRSEIAIDLASRSVARGKASQEFVDAVLKSFGI